MALTTSAPASVKADIMKSLQLLAPITVTRNLDIIRNIHLSASSIKSLDLGLVSSLSK